MTAIEPEVCDSGRYSAAETYRALGISKKTLASYTERGLIKCGYRRGTLRKFYPGSEIRRFWRATM